MNKDPTIHPCRFEETPIVRDMRLTARELGIVDLLLEHQRIDDQPSHAYDLVEEALIRLGVSNRELRINLSGLQIARRPLK